MNISQAENNLPCHGPYAGKAVTRQDIEGLIKTRALQTTLQTNNATQYIDICGAILKNVDLSKMNLTYLDLRNAQLQKANFSDSDLSNGLFQGANLLDANLNNAYLPRTNFTGAMLSNAILNHANISHADLSNARLERASLKNAALNNSNFENANLRLTTLDDANFAHSNLSGIDLTNATLIHVNFTDANLEGANLVESNLENSNFTHANLNHASLKSASLKNVMFLNTSLLDTDFADADLAGALYKPKIGFLPNIMSFTSAKNFKQLKFYDSKLGAPAMTELRNAYRNAGMRNMERLITAMVKTEDMKSAWHRGGLGYIEASFEYLFFYLTCDFGAAPGRPMGIILMLIFIFAIPTWFAIAKASSKPYIYKIMLEEPLHDVKKISSLMYQPPKDSSERMKYELKQALTALHISLMSSFQIGFYHVDISAWIARLQSMSYYYVTTGWIRPIAGLQSLISIYLVVLWALSYFGHPFEW